VPGLEPPLCLSFDSVLMNGSGLFWQYLKRIDMKIADVRQMLGRGSADGATAEASLRLSTVVALNLESHSTIS
jgi:hypothetical protein